MKEVTSEVMEKKKPPDAGHLIPRARLWKMWRFHRHFNKHFVGSLHYTALLRDGSQIWVFSLSFFKGRNKYAFR